MHGSAMSVASYAEDPLNDFVPTPAGSGAIMTPGGTGSGRYRRLESYRFHPSTTDDNRN